MRRIVVLGAGFGGLHAIHYLERALAGRRRTRLTVVTDRSHFLFTPLLPNVANEELSIKSITVPLRDHLERDTELIIDRVEAIDLDARVLHAQNSSIPFDYLLLAPGAETDWRGHDDWRPHALTCKSGRDAILIRDSIRRAYQQAAHLDEEARRRRLTFTFAGAGPTGVELAAELRAALELDVFPHAAPELVRDTRFVLIDPGDEILPELPGELRHIATRHLERAGVELELGRSVTGREDAVVHLDDGREIASEHFFWCAGVKPSSLIAEAGLAIDERGRAHVDDALQALDHEGVFLAGDAALPPQGAQQTAQVAKQQGPIAAQNLVAALSGRTPRAWRERHLGDMVTLGRGHAAVSVMGVSLEGLAAYAMYRVAYAGLMPGPMKKARIIAEWLEHDITSQSGAPPMLER